MNFHSGAITDMAVSDCVNMAVSCAQDGTIKLWDYARQQPIYERKFNGRAECLDLLRRSDVNKGRVAAVGYESGIVRVVYFAEDTIELGRGLIVSIERSFCHPTPSIHVLSTGRI